MAALSIFAIASVVALAGIIVVLFTRRIERLVNPGIDWLILFLWTALFFASPYWGAISQRKHQQNLREPMRLHFTTDRVLWEGPHFSKEIAWSQVRAIYETKTAFLIYPNVSSGMMIVQYKGGGHLQLTTYHGTSVRSISPASCLHGFRESIEG